MSLQHLRQRVEGFSFSPSPRASAVNLPTRFPSTNGEEDAIVVHLAHFIATQEKALESTVTKLQGAYEMLQLAEERVAELEEALYVLGPKYANLDPLCIMH